MAFRMSQRSARIYGTQLKRFKATAVEVSPEELQYRPVEWNDAKPFDQIPGAKPWPVIGTMWQFFPFVGLKIKEQTNQLKLAQQRVDVYGRISKDVMPGWPLLVWTTQPEDAETLFRSEGRFPTRTPLQTMLKHRQSRSEFLQSGGLLNDNGEKWWRVRSKAQQPLLKTKNIKNYLPTIGHIADEFIDRIRLIRLGNNEMKPDFTNELHRWALESVAVVALNTRLGCLNPNLDADSEAQKMITAVNVSFKNMAELELSIPFWRFINTPKLKELFSAQDYFIETSFKYIQKTMEKIKNRPEDSEQDPTILEELLSRGLSTEDAVVMVMDMLMAGIDTTSHSTSFLMYLLARNPDKQDKLREEVLRVVGPRGTPVTAPAVNELYYLKACVKETLRLMPVIFGNQRVTDKDMVLSGYQIPKGTMVITCHEWMCRQEEYFPKANDFIPERWIKGHPLESNAHPYAMLPFGFGTRMCIGRRLAELEIWQLTCKLIQNFSIEYHHEDIECYWRLLNVPSKPLRVSLIDLDK
nr:CYP362A3 protein [Diaphanosoma celebensis]